MKEQYIVGTKARSGFIRITDGIYLLGCSLNLDEAKEAKKMITRSKIYKLVEVKK